MQQPSLLGDCEKDQAIDEAQELGEVVLEGKLAADQPGPKLRIIGDEALPQRQQSRFDAIAQPVARSQPFLACRLAPALKSAIGRRRPGRAETARMDQQPQHGEIGKAVRLEHLPKISFDIGGAGEARVVAHQAQTLAIAAQAPQRPAAGVQPVLQGQRRGPPAPVHGKLRRSVVEVFRRVRHDDWRSSAERLERHDIVSAVVFAWPRRA